MTGKEEIEAEKGSERGMDMRFVFVTGRPLLYWGAGKGSLSPGQRISVYGVFW